MLITSTHAPHAPSVRRAPFVLTGTLHGVDVEFYADLVGLHSLIVDGRINVGGYTNRVRTVRDPTAHFAGVTK